LALSQLDVPEGDNAKVWKLFLNNRAQISFSSTDILLVLLQRSLLPGGIILQGVLLLQGSMSVFACHYG
jgi:hypothetical protein